MSASSRAPFALYAQAPSSPGEQHPPRPAQPPPSTTGRYINQALEAAGDVEAVLEIVAADAAHFNAVNCATALTRLSRFAFRARAPSARLARDPRFRRLLQATGAQMDAGAGGAFGPAQQNQLLSAFVSTNFWSIAFLFPFD